MAGLGGGHEYCFADGLAAFEMLDGCDLFVAMGLHWTGMNAEWAGKMAYHPLEPAHQAAFEAYVASGRPIIAHHGGIASYDDWPRYGELLGFTWVWGVTTHSPLGDHKVDVLRTGHPIVAGLEDYTLFDELYYDVQVTQGLATAVHAVAEWDGQPRPDDHHRRGWAPGGGGAHRVPGQWARHACVRRPGAAADLGERRALGAGVRLPGGRVLPGRGSSWKGA